MEQVIRLFCGVVPIYYASIAELVFANDASIAPQLDSGCGLTCQLR